VAIHTFVRQPMDRFVPRHDRVGRDEALTLSLRAAQRRGNPCAHHHEAIIAKILPRHCEAAGRGNPGFRAAADGSLRSSR
jgi:hypothetical protein